MITAQAKRKYYRQSTFEEHYVIVGKLSGFYLSHVTPEDETGENVARFIFTATNDTTMEQKLYVRHRCNDWHSPVSSPSAPSPLVKTNVAWHLQKL